MPRERVSTGGTIAPSGLIASASRLDLRTQQDKDVKVKASDWQRRAWDAFDVVGEFAYACGWVGNLLSKVRLTVLKNGKEVKSGLAVAAVDDLFGGPLKQQEMFRQLGLHLTCAGEGFIVGEDRGNKPRKWGVYSPLYLSNVGTAQKPVYKLGDNILEGNPIVLRQWRPHPVEPGKATAPSRGVLPVLAILISLTKRESATIDSRLFGNGLLLFPSEVDFPSQQVVTESTEPDAAPATTRTGADAILDQLVATARIAIANPESASARIPIPIQMPGDQIDNVRHVTFWSELDEIAPDLTTKAIRRLALGMDMPPEALEGTGDMNHWNSWQLEEAAIKVHTEPLLQMIVADLTEQYLWPYLEGEGMSEEDAVAYTFGVDTTELRLRPNRSKEAVELYDRGALSLDAMLRENGFNPDTDKMRELELKDWFLRKVASGSTTPELVADALRALKVPVAAVAAPDTEPTQAPDTPSTREHPVRAIPNDGVPPDIAAAANVVVYRALERAGNKLKNKIRGAVAVPDGTPAADLYRHVPFDTAEIDWLLEDAWGPCPAFGLEEHIPALETYTRMLLATRAPHTSDPLRQHLALTGPRKVA